MKHKLFTKKMIAYWRNRETLDKDLASNATTKGHKHIVNSVFKSIAGKLTPAEYRKKQIKQTRSLKMKRVALRRKQKAEGRK